MIKSFQHRGLHDFFESGSKAGIQPAHAAKLRLQLTALNAATRAQELNIPGWRLHALKGKEKEKGIWSLTVNGNWRLTFRFDGPHVILLNYVDYH